MSLLSVGLLPVIVSRRPLPAPLSHLQKGPSWGDAVLERDGQISRKVSHPQLPETVPRPSQTSPWSEALRPSATDSRGPSRTPSDKITGGRPTQSDRTASPPASGEPSVVFRGTTGGGPTQSDRTASPLASGEPSVVFRGTAGGRPKVPQYYMTSRIPSGGRTHEFQRKRGRVDTPSATQLSVVHRVTHSDQSDVPDVVQRHFTEASRGTSRVIDRRISAESVDPYHRSQAPGYGSAFTPLADTRFRPQHSSASSSNTGSNPSSPVGSDLSLELNPWLMSEPSRNMSTGLDYSHREPTSDATGGPMTVPSHLINWNHPSLLRAAAAQGHGQDAHRAELQQLVAGQSASGEGLSDVIKALTQYYLIR